MIAFIFALTLASADPPKEYNHRFNGVTEIMEDAEAFCGKRKGLLGCAYIGAKDYCIVHIVPGLSPREREEVIRHEIAHCNGWEH